MIRVLLRWFCLACATGLTPGLAYAGNSVTIVGQYLLSPNATVDIAVKLTNDVELAGVVCPLVIKSESITDFASGTQPVNCTIRWRERFAPPGDPLAELIINNTWSSMATDSGHCKQSHFGGFGGNPCAVDTIISPSCLTTTPWAVLLARNKILGPPLAPGADTSGSIVLAFELGDEPGCFVIDTTCFNMANHLLFIGPCPESKWYIPEFTRAQVCTGLQERPDTGLPTPATVLPED